MLIKCESTSSAILGDSVFRDSYGPPTVTHAKWEKYLDRDF